VIDVVENGVGRPRTDEELRVAGTDPEDTAKRGVVNFLTCLNSPKNCMVTRDFSGYDVAKELANTGNFQ